MHRLFQLLTWLFPAPFRRRYGEPMVDFCLQEWLAGKTLPGNRRWLLALRMVADMFFTAGRAWLEVLTPADRKDRSLTRNSAMDRISQDVRYALRTFARRPGFTAVIIATLALGIGANTAIFTIVNEIVLRPLPIHEPDRVVDLVAKVPGGNSFTGFSFADYQDYREGSSSALSEVSAYTARRLSLGSGADAERVVAQLTTANYFDVVAVEPWLGTVPEAGGEVAVVVLSHAFWQSRLGGDRRAIGSTVQLNGTPFTVIGIAPEGFAGTFIGYPTDVWLPIEAGKLILPGFDLHDVEARGLEFIGRLGPGVDVVQAQAALEVLSTRLDGKYPARHKGVRVGVYPTTGIDHSMRSGVHGFLGLLMAVSGLVLLVMCFNVGGLLLARAAARQREISIRFALGAGTARLTRQLLTEVFVLFVAGGLLGAFVASQLTRALLAGLADLPAPRGLELALDWRVLLFTAGAALIASLVAGLFPAREALRHDLSSGLNAGRGAHSGRRSGRLRAVFVVAQVAAAATLLVGAGLFLRSLWQGQTLDPGFDADQVVAARLTLPDDRDRVSGLQTLEEIRRGLEHIPGVAAVSLAHREPIGVATNPIEIEVGKAAAEPIIVDANRVDAGYFETTRVALMAGRSFEARDSQGSAGVAIVNESMAHRFWPSGAVGETLTIDGDRHTIVGVAANSRYLIQDAAPRDYLYLPLAQEFASRLSVLVRTAGDPAPLEAEMRGQIESVLPSQGAVRFVSLRRGIDQSLLPQRLASGIMMALGGFGLLLAALGLYGVLAHYVQQRRREIGIRLALGGRRSEVMALVVRSALRLIVSGLTIGVLLATATSPLISRFLIGVRPVDWPTLVVVAAVLISVGALASFVPARRAAAVEPSTSLRTE